MTKSENPTQIFDPKTAISSIVAELGILGTLWALFRHTIRLRARPPDADEILDNRLRRDVGLPPVESPANKWWGMRF
jgi:hypothetical protein